jgi:hypothetical protein
VVTAAFGMACRPAPGLSDDIHAPPGVKRTSGQQVLQGGPVDQFHHQIGLLPVGRLAVVVDARDVLV